MSDFGDENQVSTRDLLGRAGTGALRVALLFGSAAVALSVILTPIAQQQVARSAYGPGIDPMATGTTALGQRQTVLSRDYVIRRSVLQMPGDVCIINSNGQRSGSC
jgi:hypothetical protein